MTPNAGLGSGDGFLAVPSVPASVAAIRRYAVDAATRHGYERTAEVVQLLVSEVATNALVHGAGEVEVRVTPAGARLRIDVADASPELPWPREAGPEAENGRGLGLVAALADDWGAYLRPPGKVVWFEVGSAATWT